MPDQDTVNYITLDLLSDANLRAALENVPDGEQVILKDLVITKLSTDNDTFRGTVNEVTVAKGTDPVEVDAEVDDGVVSSVLLNNAQDESLAGTV